MILRVTGFREENTMDGDAALSEMQRSTLIRYYSLLKTTKYMRHSYGRDQLHGVVKMLVLK